MSLENLPSVGWMVGKTIRQVKEIEQAAKAAGLTTELYVRQNNKRPVNAPDHLFKCPFCGALNGAFYTVLEEHRPRCRFKGPANSQEVMVHNYFKMIHEDDKTYLPMMHAERDLAAAKKEIENLKKQLDAQKHPEPAT